MQTIEDFKQLHAELEKCLRAAYTEVNHLGLNNNFNLTLRVCDKMKLLLDQDFQGLWIMEREERVAAESVITSLLKKERRVVFNPEEDE